MFSAEINDPDPFNSSEGGTDGTGADVVIELTSVTGLNGLDVVNATAGTLYVF